MTPMIKELLKKMDAKFLKRFGYYLGGMAIGIIALKYINKQKGTTFDYGPNARVLKQIRIKDTLKIAPKAKLILEQYQLDSMDIQYALHKGIWDRDKSEVHKKPCPIYWIDARIGKKIDNTVQNHDIAFVIERCEYTATINNVIVTNH